ncbi:MAG: ABC transporter permease [Chloroflexi bacterium]|nr:ABC transporter permease [Chloroflexota bacterium]
MISALFRKAYRDVTKRRVRSVLTLLGILIGVGGVVAIVSTGENLARAQQAAYANASQNDIAYWVWNAPASLPRAVRDIDNVRAAELRVDFFTRCRWNGGNAGEGNAAASVPYGTLAAAFPHARDVYLHGIADFENQRVDQVFLRAGRFPKQGEIVIEQSALAVIPLQFGDTLTCRGNGAEPNRTFTLVGAVQTPNYPNAALLDYATLYAPSNDVIRLLGASGANGLLLKVNDLAQARDTARDVSQLLDRRNIQRNAPTLRDPQNFLGKRELDALLAVLSIFSVVGLITSGFLVANTLAAIVTEQVSEIGTLKALGGTRGQVMLVYLFSALVYGIVGTALGLLVGAFASWQLMLYVGTLLNLTVDFQMSPLGIALGVVVGIGVTLLAGALPAFGATRIPVKRALESYGITPTYGAGRLDRIVQRIVALPPLAAMSVRNLARRKGRALVTMLVIGVAVATSLAAQAVSVTVDRAIDDLFRTYRADAWLWFGEYVGENMRAALTTVEGVEEAEVWSLQNVWVVKKSERGREGEIESGRDREREREAARARLWGIPANTTLYIPKLVEGRWLRAGEADRAVISTDLVESLGVRVGDEIQVDTGDAPRAFRVVGIAIDNSVFLGSQVAGKVFVPETIVAKMQGREGWATFFAVGLTRHDSDGVDAQLDVISQKFKRYQMGSDSAAREVKGAKEQTRILTIALAAMSVLVGVIGALGVVNTITLNVLERRREIGVLRSIGASDANVMQAFLTEGLAFGIGGWLIGIVLGYPLGLILAGVMEAVLFHLNYVFTFQMVLVSLGFALLLTTIASLIPALVAARMKVKEVLRYE